MAARLGDLGLIERLVDADRSCLAARGNAPGADQVHYRPPYQRTHSM